MAWLWGYRELRKGLEEEVTEIFFDCVYMFAVVSEAKYSLFHVLA